MNKYVNVKMEEEVACIELNNPESLNALSLSLLNDLLDALDETETNPQVKMIVLSGSGRAFCAGGDIRKMQNSAIDDNKKMDRVAAVLFKMIRSKKTIIAAVHGYAMGGGFALACCSDLVFAEEDAQFGLSQGKLGLTADLGLNYFLSHLLGPWKAKELIYTATVISASDGKSYGFINRIVPKGTVKSEALQFAKKLVKGPVLAHGFTKRIINQAYFQGIDDTVLHENNAQSILKQTGDFLEGVQAFKEKRTPEFLGR